ncbi:OmpW family outer membrane protein [Denitrificimonas sp. JX-1]|uniref:OmpW family outer membrane protein n=1 Tax=Denitrificimonas halotolerans TaxID=3098930 RepID=A0ABU5GQP0_9GAMM|nr:OmpW family outer membrane protein [Denitrificimonas sp. JX-1]MDY7219306.1 OmpW family outer membrane protein [Denitrificimonas sp. JX-1]
MRKTLFATSLLALAVAAPSVQAHQAGDIIVRAGAVTVQTHESTSSVKGDRGALAGDNLGGKASVNNDTQLGLNFAYMITDQWAVELLAATPFSHDVKIKGTGLVDGKLGSFKHLPPTLSAVYYPLKNNSAFKPYVGAGINYTWFFDESISGSAKNNGARDFTSLNINNSWGWAAQVGADYMLTDNIMLNGQIRYIDIDTTAYASHKTLGRAKVNVDVKPWVYMLGLGYKF